MLAASSTTKKRRQTRRRDVICYDCMDSLANVALSFDDGFYCEQCPTDIVTRPLKSKVLSPEANVAVMMQRAESVYAKAKRTFKRVSGIYVGMTSCDWIATRYSHHLHKASAGSCVILVAVGCFTEDDVPGDAGVVTL